MKKKRKKTPRKILRDKLDKKWSELVKAKGHCEYCGKTTYLNAHHFYSRSALSTRWCLENGFCLCSGHHTLIAKFSAHKSPSEFFEWSIKYRGNDWYEKLKTKHNTIVDWSDADLQTILEELEQGNE